MRSTYLLFLLFFLNACNRGEWVTDGAYRAKKPNFSIKKSSTKPAALFRKDSASNTLYIATKGIENFDGTSTRSYFGLYADGRLITGSVKDTSLLSRLTYETAPYAGRYDITNDSLHLEYFVPADGGTYIKNEGIVKGDTIVLISKIKMLKGKEIRYDTLLKTNYFLR